MLQKFEIIKIGENWLDIDYFKTDLSMFFFPEDAFKNLSSITIMWFLLYGFPFLFMQMGLCYFFRQSLQKSKINVTVRYIFNVFYKVTNLMW